LRTPSESGDFTPWLAENIDVLADALEMTLTVVATEVRIGDFRLDIHAKDGNDRSVVIEYQLERTDHGHLPGAAGRSELVEASTRGPGGDTAVRCAGIRRCTRGVVTPTT